MIPGLYIILASEETIRKNMNTNRRKFIKNAALGCGSLLMLQGCRLNESPWRFFNEQEMKVLVAVCEQIIPADLHPGAKDANVVNFIDKQIVGPYVRFQEDYRFMLSALNVSANQLCGGNFFNLPPEKQIFLMERMEKGELAADTWKDKNQPYLFNLLVDHTMQGFYGSPRHGGNKNYCSYKMIGLDYPHVIGQNRYGSGCRNSEGKKDEK